MAERVETLTRTFIWPCDHGGVRVEENIPPHHRCAECGAEPVEYVGKDHWEEACQHIEALLDAGRSDPNARFNATLYLSKFESIGVPDRSATGEGEAS